VVCRVEFDADGEVCRDDLSGFGYDVQNEFGSLFNGASVFICPEVCLLLSVSTSFRCTWIPYLRVQELIYRG